MMRRILLIALVGALVTLSAPLLTAPRVAELRQPRVSTQVAWRPYYARPHFYRPRIVLPFPLIPRPVVVVPAPVPVPVFVPRPVYPVWVW